jgi:hypothetical protein
MLKNLMINIFLTGQKLKILRQTYVHIINLPNLKKYVIKNYKINIWAHIIDWPKDYNIFKITSITWIDFGLAKRYYIINQTYVQIIKWQKVIA